MNIPTLTIRHTVDEAFLSRWQELWDQSPYGYFHNSPKFFIAARDGFNVEKYIILVVETEGRLDAVFPLVWEKRFGVTVLCNPGERFTDKSTLLLREKDPTVIQVLIKKLMELGNLYLEELSEDLTDMMLAVNPSLVKQEASVNPYLPLQPDPFQFMTSKMRNKMRNRIIRLGSQLSHKYYAGDMAGLELAFSIDAKSTKRNQAKSDLARERERNYFRKLLQENGKNFVVDVLFYENAPVIYLIAATYKTSYHAWLTAYNGEYGFLSPGKMLYFYIFDRLVKEGYELVDFSRGHTYLKSEFTNLSHTQYDIIYAKNNLVKYWWQSTNFLYNFIVGSKFLYGTYRIGKKFFYR